MFPKEMDRRLDANVLVKLGLTRRRMETGDAAFFLQLILPFCDPSELGVADDPRKLFFTEEERFTNISKFESGKGSACGHKWKPTTAQELVHFHGIAVRDSVLGLTNGAIYRRWMKGASFDQKIVKTMRLTRFSELKRSLKLCYNNSCLKRTQPGCDPACKFDLTWNVMIFNCNGIAERAEENQTTDETTWAHGGY